MLRRPANLVIGSKVVFDYHGKLRVGEVVETGHDIFTAKLVIGGEPRNPYKSFLIHKVSRLSINGNPV